MPSTTKHSDDTSSVSTFAKAMHGKSAEERNAFMSMLKKDGQAHRIITDDYLKYWEMDEKAAGKTQEARDGRKAQYMSLVNKCVYYLCFWRTDH